MASRCLYSVYLNLLHYSANGTFILLKLFLKFNLEQLLNSLSNKSVTTKMKSTVKS